MGEARGILPKPDKESNIELSEDVSCQQELDLLGRILRMAIEWYKGRSVRFCERG